jgi:hypothetical protein
MLAGGDGDGSIVVTTNRDAGRIAADCERNGLALTTDSAAIIDCVGDEGAGVPARLLTVAGPADLTGIGMRFSDVYREFTRDSVDRVRTSVVSISTLVTFSDLRTVARFVHTLTARVAAIGGLGVLLVDPTNHDERTVGTLAQFCDGRVMVRDGADGPELRVRGLADQRRDWVAFDV